MGDHLLSDLKAEVFHFSLPIASKMSKLLLASIGLFLVVFVSANTETERQKKDLSLQNDLLTREAREAGTKDRKKGKNRKVKKKTRKPRKNKGSRRRNGKKETIRKRNKIKKRKGGNKQTNRRGGKPIRRKGRNQSATTTGPP